MTAPNDSPSPTPRQRIPGALGYLLVITAAAWAAYVSIHLGADPYVLVANGSLDAANQFQMIDESMREATERGNALLLFEGFDLQTDPKLFLPELLYCRGNYAVYPRRLLLGDDRMTFSNGQSLIKQSRPSPKWLKDHDIQCTLLVTRQPNGLYNMELTNPYGMELTNPDEP